MGAGLDGGTGVMGGLAAAAVLALVLVLIPLRFASAVRHAARDPEFRGLLVLVVVTIAAGSLFYWQIEGWTLFDAFYFCAMTLTTVGYGDLSPETVAGKLFTVFYLFAGIGLLVGFLNAVAKATLQQREERQGLSNHRKHPDDS